MHCSYFVTIKNNLTILLLLISTAFIIPYASASTVQQITLSQAAQTAAFIFEGQVISKQVRYAQNGEPFTFFTFQILDVIKGSHPAVTIEIGYMGGTNADGLTLQVSDMRMPELGEHGVYFVESLTRQQVHPLFGWQQGHYLVMPAQANTAAKVVPVETPSGAMVVAPSLNQFKQQVRALAAGNGS